MDILRFQKGEMRNSNFQLQLADTLSDFTILYIYCLGFNREKQTTTKIIPDNKNEMV